MTPAGKRGVAPFDAGTGRFGDMLYEFPPDAVNAECFRGNDLLVTTAETLDSVDNSSKERESLFGWMDNNINYQAVSVLGADETSVVCFSRTLAGGGANATLVTLRRVPASSVKEKEILTLAVAGPMNDYLRGAVIAFNRSSQDCKVETVTYGADDVLAGVQKLNAEIVSGTAPDILMLDASAFPVGSYNEKGILVDLYRYLDEEPDIRLHPAALRLLEQDGKLSMISPGSSVLTMIGDAGTVGAEPGWSLSDVEDALKRNPGRRAFPDPVTQMSFYLYELILNLQDFFDKDAGISRFDSDEFKAILNFTKDLPEDYPSGYKGIADDIESGNYLVSEFVNIATFGEVALYESLFEGKQAYKGIPCEGRNGNILAMPLQLAMNEACGNKDAAWSFMRTLLTEEFQSGIEDQFPTNMKAFDALAEEATREPEEDDAVKFVYYSVNGNIWRDPAEHEWALPGKKPKTVSYFVDAMFMPL
jgi:ABC-type glycerol-3-phosphate transport system substrate-binding protein